MLLLYAFELDELCNGNASLSVPFLLPLLLFRPMWCVVQTSTLRPILTFKTLLSLISFSLCRVSPLPGSMWEFLFWSVLHRKRLAEECHRECYWRGTGGAVRVWRVWRRGKQCFVSSLCLLLPWVAQPRQEFESKCIRITKFIAAKLSK